MPLVRCLGRPKRKSAHDRILNSSVLHICSPATSSPLLGAQFLFHAAIGAAFPGPASIATSSLRTGKQGQVLHVIGSSIAAAAQPQTRRWVEGRMSK